MTTFAEQMVAKYKALLASAVDNHWLDYLVGCAAAASMLGVLLFRGAGPKKVKRKRKRVAYIS